MQQDKNDIENQLRQLENKQLPDLSHMDEHWQEMQQMLAPAVHLSKTGNTNFLKINRKILFLAASVIAIFLVIWISQNRFANKGNEKKDAGIINVPDASLEKEPADNMVLSDSLVKAGTKITNLTFGPIYAVAAFERRFNQGDSVGIDEGNGEAMDFFTKTGNAPGLPQAAKITLTNFYDQIQKQPQGFLLNAEKGGLITCAEGTSLVIPTSAFVDENGNRISGEVKIIVLEYYKYSEMVAANLSTMSDGRQLITGGMVRITAEQGGRSVKLRNDKAIDLNMPAKNYDEAMQLFVSASETNKIPASYAVDTVAYETSSSARYRNINWQQSGLQSSMPVFNMETNFMNMQDDPVATRGRDGRIAVFKIPLESPYTAEEAKKILEEKYGDYYQKIKVKKVKRERRIFNFWGPRTYLVRTTIGDSVRLSLNDALRGRYIDRKDSVFYAEKIRRDSIQYYKIYFDNISQMRSTEGNRYIKTQQTYSFRIQNLGWINCDRFSDYTKKADFVINLPQGVNAENFVCQLVFMSVRSVLPGKMLENKIGFLNVPVNMRVYLVGLGEKDGKVVSFMEKLDTGEKEIDLTNFEETTAEAFKRKLTELDLQ